MLADLQVQQPILQGHRCCALGRSHGIRFGRTPVVTADWLRKLADDATLGPWAAGIEEDREAYVFSVHPDGTWVTPRPEPFCDGGVGDADARLIALAPDLARGYADAADALRIIPFAEWQELADSDIMDLIDADTMIALLSAARDVLARLGCVAARSEAATPRASFVSWWIRSALRSEKEQG
jgi:hypothetical protein